MATNTAIEHRTADIYVEAPPEQVYDVVSDLNRLGELSAGVERFEYIEGYKEPGEGAKFQEHGRDGILGSTNECRMITTQRGSEFAWDVVDGETPVTRWRFRMGQEGDGTRLYHSVEVFHAPLTEKISWLLQGGQENRFEKLEGNMQKTLERIKEAVESEAPVAASQNT